MIKTLVVLACLLGVALAAPASGAADRGYEAKRTSTVGSFFYAYYVVTPADLAGATEFAGLKLTVDATGFSNTANIDYYTSMNAEPTTASTKIGAKATTDGSNTYTIPVYNSTIPSQMGAGTYFIAGNIIACATCLGSPKSVDVTISAQLIYTTAGVTTNQPFPAVHNPFTIDYSTPPSTFAVPSAFIEVPTGTTKDVYVRVDVSTASSTTAKVVMTYKNGSIPVTSEYSALKKYPTGSPVAGDYSTGAITLGEGKWYITPYCAETASSSINCPYDFAIGIGAEPAGARAAALPGVIIAIVALVASAINW